MKLYKLTDEYSMTKNATRWGPGITHKASRGKAALCSDSVVHAYRTPCHAFIFNCAHAGFDHPIFWEAEGNPTVDDGTKVGCKKLTTIKKVKGFNMSDEEMDNLLRACAHEIAIPLLDQVIPNGNLKHAAEQACKCGNKYFNISGNKSFDVDGFLNDYERHHILSFESAFQKRMCGFIRYMNYAVNFILLSGKKFHVADAITRLSIAFFMIRHLSDVDRKKLIKKLNEIFERFSVNWEGEL